MNVDALLGEVALREDWQDEQQRGEKDDPAHQRSMIV
jgi:hypothetical protein